MIFFILKRVLIITRQGVPPVSEGSHTGVQHFMYIDLVMRKEQKALVKSNDLLEIGAKKDV